MRWSPSAGQESGLLRERRASLRPKASANGQTPPPMVEWPSTNSLFDRGGCGASAKECDGDRHKSDSRPKRTGKESRPSMSADQLVSLFRVRNATKIRHDEHIFGSSHCTYYSFSYRNSGTTLCWSAVDVTSDKLLIYFVLLVPGEGFEPPANGLQNHWRPLSRGNRP